MTFESKLKDAREIVGAIPETMERLGSIEAFKEREAAIEEWYLSLTNPQAVFSAERPIDSVPHDLVV